MKQKRYVQSSCNGSIWHLRSTITATLQCKHFSFSRKVRIILQPHDALLILPIHSPYHGNSRSQWPHCLRRRSAAARLLSLWVRITQGALMSLCCEYCVLSGRGLCDKPITRPEVMPRRVWPRNLVKWEAMANWGLSCQRQTSKQIKNK